VHKVYRDQVLANLTTPVSAMRVDHNEDAASCRPEHAPGRAHVSDRRDLRASQVAAQAVASA
jgi:hypothetical protein